MSRNSSRVAAAPPPESQTEQPQQVARRTANTDFVELPSKGLYYPVGHPLQGKEVVEIRYMTARDEDILTSPTLLKKGLALDKFVQNILVDQSIRVDDLLLGDKSAIMIAARITGYGPEYEVKVTCPECDSESENVFDISEYEKYYTSGESEHFTLLEDGTFSAILPLSQQEVVVRMITSKDERRITKLTETKTKNNLAESPTTDTLKTFIVSIDGVTRAGELEQMIMNLPARDSLFLRKNYGKLVPKVDMVENFECIYCGTETALEVPLEAGFFWPE
tara:strand:- start:1058 stop:1891 length:834 start_codon:yes stop_codon:yes gene_type:complete